MPISSNYPQKSPKISRFPANFSLRFVASGGTSWHGKVQKRCKILGREAAAGGRIDHQDDLALVIGQVQFFALAGGDAVIVDHLTSPFSGRQSTSCAIRGLRASQCR